MHPVRLEINCFKYQFFNSKVKQNDTPPQQMAEAGRGKAQIGLLGTFFLKLQKFSRLPICIDRNEYNICTHDAGAGMVGIRPCRKKQVKGTVAAPR